MKAEEIIELFRQFESIANEYEGVECPSFCWRQQNDKTLIFFPTPGK